MNLDPRTWSVDPRKWKLTGGRRTAAYVAFFVLAFVVALRLTFPVEAVRERLILDAGARGFQVKVNDLSPSGLAGVRARGVTVTTSEGTRIPFEELSVGLRPWPTLMGRRAFSFDASLFDGRVVGFAEVSSTTERYQARVTGIDLARAGVVRAATGLDLAGILSGNLDVTLDPRDPSKSSGSIEFQVKDGSILGGRIPERLAGSTTPGEGGPLCAVPRQHWRTCLPRAPGAPPTVRGGRCSPQLAPSPGAGSCPLP